MNKQLEEIKESLSKATQGPWKVDVWEKTNEVGIEYGISKYVAVMGNKNENKHQDARLIANAPQWLASLVSEVERLQEIDERESLVAISVRNENRLLKAKVEEMQKTLVEIANMRPSLCTWSDEEYYENFSKCEEIAQQTLQSLKGDKP